MIREIENIFLDFPGYGCFACDPRNDKGLRLKFFADDEKGDVFTKIVPEKHLQGFPGIGTALAEAILNILQSLFFYMIIH